MRVIQRILHDFHETFERWSVCIFQEHLKTLRRVSFSQNRFADVISESLSQVHRSPFSPFDP